MTSPTSGSAPRPAFVNPFERQRSADKVPTLAAMTPYQPLLTEDHPPEASSTGHSTSPTGASNGTWRNRAASIFPGFGNNSSNSSSNNYVTSGGAIQLKSDLARDRTQSVVAQRKPSYVPKYAARAHMASMSGRSMMMGSEKEADDQLRRGSRMMSVAFPAGQRPSVAFAPGQRPDISVGTGISEE